MWYVNKYEAKENKQRRKAPKMQGQADTLYASAVHARKKTRSQRNDKKLRKEEGEMGVSIKKTRGGE